MTDPSSPIPAQRKRLYAAIIIVIPILVIVGAEILLRFAGYGTDPVYFVEQNIGGRTYLRLDQAVAGRYFPRMDVQPAASSDVFLEKKDDGVVRVFFLGASSMLGYPYMHNASMSAIIRDALREDYPDRSFEIVNVSMTAVTSQFVREFGDACLMYEPDLIVIYAGHNEYYGGMGVASTESIGPPWLTRLYLNIQHFRIIQALTSLLNALFSAMPEDQAVSGTLMEALAGEKEIPFDSDLFHAGIITFRNNVGELIENAGEAGVPVIVSTVVSNLRDLPPFRSIHGVNVGQSARDSIDLLLMDDVIGSPGATSAESAYLLDTSYAASVFAMGKEYERQGELEKAYELYKASRDFDGLRFRAPSLLNQAIIGLAQHPGVTVIDADRSVRSVSYHGIPGNDLFHEHVHPTIVGYEQLASILYPDIRRILGLPEPERSAEGRLVARVTPIDTITAHMRLDILLHSWPFTDTRRSLSDIRPEGWEEEIAYGYLEGTYTWEQMHVMCAERYEAMGLTLQAVREYEALRSATPYNISPYLRLGSLYMALGERNRSRRILESSLEVERSSRASMMLGQLAYEEGRFEDAIDALRQALSVGQLTVQSTKDVRLSLAVAFHKAGRTPEALDEVKRLLSFYPDFVPARQFEAFLAR